MTTSYPPARARSIPSHLLRKRRLDLNSPNTSVTCTVFHGFGRIPISPAARHLGNEYTEARIMNESCSLFMIRHTWNVSAYKLHFMGPASLPRWAIPVILMSNLSHSTVKQKQIDPTPVSVSMSIIRRQRLHDFIPHSKNPKCNNRCIS